MEGQLQVESLIHRRDDLKAELAQVGDMRPGSLTPRFRKCGKPTCHCAHAASPGYGPSWSLTREVQGKTVTKILPSAEAVAATQQQLAEFRPFCELTRELVEVSDRLCEAKLQSWKAGLEATAQKGASKAGSQRRSSRSFAGS